MTKDITFYGKVKNPNMYVDSLWTTTPMFKFMGGNNGRYNIKIVFDGETNKLKYAEVLDEQAN